MNENYIGIEPVMVGVGAGEWTRFHLKGGEQ